MTDPDILVDFSEVFDQHTEDDYDISTRVRLYIAKSPPRITLRDIVAENLDSFLEAVGSRSELFSWFDQEFGRPPKVSTFNAIEQLAHVALEKFDPTFDEISGRVGHAQLFKLLLKYWSSHVSAGAG